MTPGRELFFASFVLLCLCCLGNLVIITRIQIHIRRHHPDIWRSFGNPRIPFFAVMGDEGHPASPAFHAFLQSNRRRALQDETLDRLILMKRWLVWMAVPLFVACAAMILVVKP